MSIASCCSSYFLPVFLGISIIARHVFAADAILYDFRVDGEPFRPARISLSETPDQPAPGDLIFVYGTQMWLRLGDEPKQHFFTTPEEDGRLFIETNSTGRKVVGVEVDWTYQDRVKIIYNPFEKLSPQEMRSLRGVYLDSLPAKWDEITSHLDSKQVCLTIGSYAIAKDGKFPKLPDNLVALRIDETNNVKGIKEYAPLLKQTSLRHLSINSMTGPVDLANLRNCISLEDVTISAWKPLNFQSLSHLTSMRSLRFGRLDDLENIDFVRQMPELRQLDIAGSKVTDLTPLTDLQMLETVNADRAPVQRLPANASLPALKTMRLMSTSLTEEAVDAFADSEPNATVYFYWDRSLKKALKAADRVRVRTGGTCHREPQNEKTLVEEKDPVQIQRLIKSIRINEGESGFHCMCCGDPSIEFYQKDKLLLTLGYHHGRSLRWSEGWPGDALLTAPGADALKNWLVEHRVSVSAQQ